MLICTELLLVATSHEGKRLAGQMELDLALAGAVLCELAAGGRVAVQEGRLVVNDAGSSGDALLDHALEVFAKYDGKKPEKVLPHLAKGMTDRTYERLATDGMVRVEPGGFLRSTKYPVVDTATRKTLVAAAAQVLAGTTRPDLHTGALISLLAAADGVTKVYDSRQFGVSGRELTKRAKAVGEQDWASGAAAAAIKSAQDATMAAVIAATTAATVAATVTTT